jgi:hypothetical protein
LIPLPVFLTQEGRGNGVSAPACGIGKKTAVFFTIVTRLASYWQAVTELGTRTSVQDSYLPRLYGRGTMSQIYRSSRFIDFNEGRVVLDPESFVDQASRPWTLEQKIDFFECRVDVWQLGVAVEMLKQIEAHEPPSIWSHAAYGLLSVIASYFEMVGKVLNPRSGPRCPFRNSFLSFD